MLLSQVVTKEAGVGSFAFHVFLHRCVLVDLQLSLKIRVVQTK